MFFFFRFHNFSDCWFILPSLPFLQYWFLTSFIILVFIRMFFDWYLYLLLFTVYLTLSLSPPLSITLFSDFSFNFLHLLSFHCQSYTFFTVPFPTCIKYTHISIIYPYSAFICSVSLSSPLWMLYFFFVFTLFVVSFTLPRLSPFFFMNSKYL